MSLSGLSRTAATERFTFSGPPVAIRIEKIADGEIIGGILIDGPHGRPGTMLKIVDSKVNPAARIIETLLGYTKDDRRVGGTGVGDVVVFDHGIVKDGELIVDTIATRVHDGMHGRVQLSRMLMRPTKSWVSSHGAGQYMTLADAAGAKHALTENDFFNFITARLASEWPGGRPGVILRGKLGVKEIQIDEDEAPAAFARRLVEDGEMSGGPVEVIPTWTLPASRLQVARDGDIRNERPSQIGPFGSLYQNARGRLAFKPSLVIIADEDEWSHGGRTGKIVRVIAGAQPFRTDVAFLPDTIPTRAVRAPVIPTTSFLYADATAVDAAMAKRHERFPPPPPEAAPANPRRFPGRTASYADDGPDYGEDEPRAGLGSGGGMLGGLGRR